MEPNSRYKLGFCGVESCYYQSYQLPYFELSFHSKKKKKNQLPYLDLATIKTLLIKDSTLLIKDFTIQILLIKDLNAIIVRSY